MHHGAESAAARLLRDKAERREQELSEARAHIRTAGEKVAILTAENHRLAAENARLRAQLGSDMLQAKAETEMQMNALREALIPLLANDS
jgi:regulator of replication initiation timing